MNLLKRNLNSPQSGRAHLPAKNSRLIRPDLGKRGVSAPRGRAGENWANAASRVSDCEAIGEWAGCKWRRAGGRVRIGQTRRLGAATVVCDAYRCVGPRPLPPKPSCPTKRM